LFLLRTFNKSTCANKDNKGKLLVTFFAFLPAGSQVLLHPRQIRTMTAKNALSRFFGKKREHNLTLLPGRYG
jgi:hypothetical protein